MNFTPAGSSPSTKKRRDNWIEGEDFADIVDDEIPDEAETQSLSSTSSLSSPKREKKRNNKDRRLWETMVTLCLVLNSIWLLTWWIWRNDWTELDGYLYSAIAGKIYALLPQTPPRSSLPSSQQHDSASIPSHPPILPWHSYSQMLFIYFVCTWIYSLTLFVCYFFFTPPSQHQSQSASKTTSFLYAGVFARLPAAPIEIYDTELSGARWPQQHQHSSRRNNDNNHNKQLLRLHRGLVTVCVGVDVVLLVLFGLIWSAEFELVFIFIDAFSPFIHAILLLLFTAFSRPFILYVFSPHRGRHTHNTPHHRKTSSLCALLTPLPPLLLFIDEAITSRTSTKHRTCERGRR